MHNLHIQVFLIVGLVLYILQPPMTMRASCFVLRQAAHFLRPVIRRLPSSALSYSPFICSRNIHARSAASLFHSVTVHMVISHIA